jgi:hypothetical protein
VWALLKKIVCAVAVTEVVELPRFVGCSSAANDFLVNEHFNCTQVPFEVARVGDLPPPEIGLTLLGFDKSEQGWLVSAAGCTGSECPSCGMQSTARHSRYWRQLQDLPVQGKRVALRLRLSRWRCRNRECEQAIFRERLGEVVAPWARRTSRVEEVLLLVGHRTGGRAAEFLLKRLSMAVSDDTILRRLRPVKLLDMIV